VPTAQPSKQEAFESVAMPHLAALLRVARRLTLEPSSAEDLVQETMLLAWRGFHGFQAGTNARAWLFRILFNVFHAEGRRMSRTPDLGPTAVRPMLQEAAEIAEALEALSLEHRTVLLLCVVEGFTCREAAEIQDLPIGTVMSRLSRARQELRKSLAGSMQEVKAKEAYR
jgi:RNA polymerase sigma-70 factor (ECF subfamily)